MSNWQQHRQMLISLTLAGVFLTLGRFSLDPNAGKRPMAAFSFPSVVPLPEWQLLESSPIAEPTVRRTDDKDDFGAILANRKYLYRQNDQQLEIEMRYAGGTFGDLQFYLNDYASIWLENAKLLQNLRQQEGVGFYSLFVHQGRSHLAACINPRGGSTVTIAQFFANRRTYDLQVGRLVPWLLGKESLQDRRCLWTHLSTNHGSAETTYPVLEKAWRSWYQWWSARFPQH